MPHCSQCKETMEYPAEGDVCFLCLRLRPPKTRRRKPKPRPKKPQLELIDEKILRNMEEHVA
jgi:hypothetical protein